MSHSQQISSSLDQHVLAIQQAVTRTHNAVLSQPEIVNELLRSISLNPAYHITSLEQPTQLPFSSGQGHETAAVEIDSDYKKWQFRLTGDASQRSEVPRERSSCNFSTYQKRRSPTDTDDPKGLYWARPVLSKCLFQRRTVSINECQLIHLLSSTLASTCPL